MAREDNLHELEIVDVRDYEWKFDGSPGLIAKASLSTKNFPYGIPRNLTLLAIPSDRFTAFEVTRSDGFVSGDKEQRTPMVPPPCFYVKEDRGPEIAELRDLDPST